MAGRHRVAGDQGLRSGDTVSANGRSLFTSMMRPARFWKSGLRIVNRLTAVFSPTATLPGEHFPGITGGDAAIWKVVILPSFQVCWRLRACSRNRFIHTLGIGRPGRFNKELQEVQIRPEQCPRHQPDMDCDVLQINRNHDFVMRLHSRITHWGMYTGHRQRSCAPIGSTLGQGQKRRNLCIMNPTRADRSVSGLRSGRRVQDLTGPWPCRIRKFRR